MTSTAAASAVPQAPATAAGPREKAALKVAETPAELDAYHRLRREVFCEEQGIFHGDDADELDRGAIPIVAIAGGEVIGVVRCYRKWGGVWFGGRLAVARGHRTGTVGARLVRKACELVEVRREVRRFFATVQAQNVHFFERLGWHARGRAFVLKGVEHRLMEYPLAGRRA